MLKQVDAAMRESIWRFINLHDRPEFVALPVREVLLLAVASAGKSLGEEASATLKIEAETRKALGQPDPTRT